MTEQEAKEKWCPFARQGASFGSMGEASFGFSYNRSANSLPGNCNCIGSACMAWRWNKDWSSMTEEGHGGDVMLRLVRREGEPRIGYCGLAGKP